jgi:hypothetical protein
VATGKACRGNLHPGLYFIVAFEAVVATMGILPHSHEARVRVLVVAIPEAAVPGLLCQVSERLGDEFYGSRGIGHEDEFKVGRICPKESQCLFSDLIHHFTRTLCGKVF